MSAKWRQPSSSEPAGCAYVRAPEKGTGGFSAGSREQAAGSRQRRIRVPDARPEWTTRRARRSRNSYSLRSSMRSRVAIEQSEIGQWSSTLSTTDQRQPGWPSNAARARLRADIGDGLWDMKRALCFGQQKPCACHGQSRGVRCEPHRSCIIRGISTRAAHS